MAQVPEMLAAPPEDATNGTNGRAARALAGAGWDRLEAVTFGRAVIPDFT